MSGAPNALTARQRLELRAAGILAALPPRLQVLLSGRPPVIVDGQRLEPEMQLTLALLERRGAAPVEELTVEEAREATRRQSAISSGRPIPVGDSKDLWIDGVAGPLPARHYAPVDEPGGRPPLIVYFHGGGFVVGDLDTHDGLCRMLCRHSGAHVLSVDYRLAPENPFPAAVEDATAALRWAQAHAATLGADPRVVAVGGDSAGANLAAVAAWLAARSGEPVPAMQLLLYPAADATARRRSHELFGEDYFLTSKQMDWYLGHYIRGGGDLTDPRLSIVLADDLSGLPPALVVTAGFDPLRDEGEAFAAALREAGTPVVLRRFPGLVHGFARATGVSRAARDALVEVAGATRALLAVARAQAGAAPADERLAA